MVKVGLAHGAFQECFKEYFPEAVLVSPQRPEEFDLIIFPGGVDINPSTYGRNNTYSTNTSLARDIHERSVYQVYQPENDKGRTKFLGVCRGHQLLNALRGGTLVQDIYFELGNEVHPSWHPLEIIDSNSKVCRLFPQGVNSLHHQAVYTTGLSMNPTGIVRTKANRNRVIIEVTEGEDIIGVQFHPEFMDRSYAEPFFEYIKEWADPKNRTTRKPSRKTPSQRYTEHMDELIRERSLIAEMERERSTRPETRTEGVHLGGARFDLPVGTPLPPIEERDEEEHRDSHIEFEEDDGFAAWLTNDSSN